MPFQFQLAALLHLRQSQLHQQELVVRAINEDADRILRELETTAIEAAEISTPGIRACSGAELRFLASRLDVLSERERITLCRLSAVLERQKSAIGELRSLWQKREALEILMKQQQDAYQLRRRREDQRLQDDLFLQRTTFTSKCANVPRPR